ncbi:hypothetical protein [Burkholderia pseudomultivorans]|uniref:hypothetical protein n=1 Tax=Burkholderia pseudomultivorans TaxID=1207504 RepID=UPI0012D94752|nr:hypothetical protein [Burkholderia pseudomultivorans]
MGPIICRRHGAGRATEISTGVAGRIRPRGQFAPGELVKVSLDRPKYSRRMWVLRAEFDALQVEATFVDKVAHVTAFTQIAALERLKTHACSACVDELLVRSGEAPDKPTSIERAFDTSLVAADAQWPHDFVRCGLHGLILPTRTSPDIEKAILSIGVVRDCHVVQVIDGASKHGPRYWFDEAFLREVLGDRTEIDGSTFRVERDEDFDQVWRAGERVCPDCLGETLKRSGLIDDETAT